MTEAVRVRDLRKSYHGSPAVDGVDLDIAEGEIFALLGPNGAGKTTTVEILEGFRKRDSGEVRVLGEDPQRASRRWRYGIGLVLQNASDMADMTVAETVRHFARYYPGPRPVDEVIELVGLTAKAGAKVRTLSGGQRRRVDVAIGVIGRPRLLFLDEPTTGFDPEARRQFWALIRLLSEQDGTTILLTTHYLDEAETLADRVGVINAGRVLAVDTPAELGGRSTAEAEVTWLENGATQSLHTKEPTAAVRDIAARFGDSAEIPHLAVHRPTLEDVYLDLIGSPR
ncbi:ABC transporter ATP-binding protein [Actinoplanes derwentensis]|uniref:ABC-2 type transport system ATP-binding protein n=1 Tax=Actinoplanes derwentensis TaxID=113562 RepID=A0A1H1YAM8_9ACTN|nr:ABC transporter ATP-binding protein [Actinoplanes derwentensis]GID90268.1 ABC transporter [Actinoplanes derwentensis]SDT18503.1 ABC-2 type transport system ATP-binding protein [Actinoplanes derwentensis]